MQLYINDPVASGLERVTMTPGQVTMVRFTLGSADVGFYANSGRLPRSTSMSGTGPAAG